MLFEINDFINTSGINTNSVNTKNNSTSLFDLDEGFLKGNMFKDLYEPYKNYNVRKIVPKNEKELLLYNIYKLCFAINDLNLYLDINPNDQVMYDTFKKYTESYNKLVCEYEEKYGVLNLNGDISTNYSWYKNPWPWEGTYV